jgi:hypothetical protein
MRLVPVNTGYHNLSNCQVTMADRNMTEPKHLCTPFALRPNEKNRIPIIKFKYSPKSQSAEAYPWVNRAGNWSVSDARWVLQLADYTIQILANDTKPNIIRIRLDYNDDWIVTPL